MLFKLSDEDDNGESCSVMVDLIGVANLRSSVRPLLDDGEALSLDNDQTLSSSRMSERENVCERECESRSACSRFLRKLDALTARTRRHDERAKASERTNARERNNKVRESERTNGQEQSAQLAAILARLFKS